METRTFEAPALYGDHHVTEVRRILLEIPGVEDVYASSAFRVIEVTFDPEKVSADEIAKRLEETGYLGELPIPQETGMPATAGNGNKSAFRHTQAYETTGNTVSFARNVSYQGRPLWPCPGMGVIKVTAGDETE